MSIDPDPNWKPLGKSAAPDRADSKSTPLPNSPRPTASSQQDAGHKGATQGTGESAPRAPVTAKKNSVLLVGPAGCGKTLLLAALEDACAHHVAGDWEIEFSQVDLAPLITARNQGQTARKGLASSTAARDYHFSVIVREPRKRDGEAGRSLGARSFSAMDGPGGALFPDEVPEGEAATSFEVFRDQLLAAGKTASSIIIMVDPIADSKKHHLADQLTTLLGQMAVEMEMSADADPVTESGLTRALRAVRGFFGGTQNNHVPAEEDSVKVAVPRLAADRVLFVLNRYDQICAEWRKEVPDLQNLSAYQIALKYSKPRDIAVSYFGEDFLSKMLAYLKPDATLAVALCSAGGFDKNTGTPYLDFDGRPSSIDTIDPRRTLKNLVLYGLKEIVLFAGYEIEAPGVAEVLTVGDIIHMPEQVAR